jgi:tRNA threonylcarbamoyladenosine biosynthesis protein TsaE
MNSAVRTLVPLDTRRCTLHLARDLARCVGPGDLVVLSGELGAGKTFLMRGVCRALGLSERVRVTSPTFSLVHEIGTVPPLLHADLYRLESAREVIDLGLSHRRDEGCILFVEWGEPWTVELGGDALVVSLSMQPRRACLTCQGPRSSKMLAQLSESRKMADG